MTTTLGNRIHAKGPYTYEEKLAQAALSPGHLLKLNSDDTVKKHNVAGEKAELIFAMENAFAGPSIYAGASGSTADTAYATGERVPVLIGQSGTWVNALLKAGTSYVEGDRLISAGDGTLEKYTLVTSTAVPAGELAVVMQALDLSGSGAVATRCPVRLMG